MEFAGHARPDVSESERVGYARVDATGLPGNNSFARDNFPQHRLRSYGRNICEESGGRRNRGSETWATCSGKRFKQRGKGIWKADGERSLKSRGTAKNCSLER